MTTTTARRRSWPGPETRRGRAPSVTSSSTARRAARTCRARAAPSSTGTAPNASAAAPLRRRRRHRVRGASWAPRTSRPCCRRPSLTRWLASASCRAGPRGAGRRSSAARQCRHSTSSSNALARARSSRSSTGRVPDCDKSAQPPRPPRPSPCRRPPARRRLLSSRRRSRTRASSFQTRRRPPKRRRRHPRDGPSVPRPLRARERRRSGAELYDSPLIPLASLPSRSKKVHTYTTPRF